jgi:hypothetical protein
LGISRIGLGLPLAAVFDSPDPSPGNRIVSPRRFLSAAEEQSDDFFTNGATVETSTGGTAVALYL